MRAAVLLPLAQRLGRIVLRRSGVKSHFVETRLGALHVYDGVGSGTLPTIVLLHGLGAAAISLGPLLQCLRRDARRVVAVEYPGHGLSKGYAGRLSPAELFDTVAGVLDKRVPESCILVGNSLGGAVATHYALACPHKVRALVLISPAGAPSSEEEWRSIQRAFDVRSSRQARVLLSRLYHRSPWYAPLVAREIPAHLRRPAVLNLLREAQAHHAFAPDTLRSLKMPVLLLWGKSDRLLPESHFRYFAQHLPSHAVIERPERFGHCPHLEDPPELASRIVSFARAQGKPPVPAA